MSAPPMFRVVEREWQVYKKLFRGLAFSTFVSPLLFLAAIGLGLGELVDEGSGTVDGLSYLDFVAPGLLIASVVQMTSAESMWPVMAGMKWMRFYHGMAATPITARDIYGGFLVWTAIRTALAAAAFVFVAALLGGIPSVWGVLAIPAAMLTSVTFAAPVAAFTATQETDHTFPVFLRIVIMPLFLFSGTFFPISELPNWLEKLAVISPMWHGVELARMATTGDFDALAVVGHVAFLVAVTAAGWFWGRRTFQRRLAE